MKRLKRWLKDYFEPEDFNGLDIDSIGQALNDSSIRSLWLSRTIADLKMINLEVDKRLLSGQGSEMGLTDLCAKRKAYQDILESVLSVRRTVVQESRPNPKVQMPAVNLDRVTA